MTQHGAFDYLARDMGLQVVGVVSAHAANRPRPRKPWRWSNLIRRLKAARFFTEPQYPARIAQVIAREAGIPAAVLDPVAGGPARAGLDYYEQAMRRNMATLKVTLGTR